MEQLMELIIRATNYIGQGIAQVFTLGVLLAGVYFVRELKDTLEYIPSWQHFSTSTRFWSVFNIVLYAGALVLLLLLAF